MKSTIYKMFAVLAMSASVNAAADSICYIYLNKPCLASPLPTTTYFKDSEAYANANAARCVERAREYKAYCRSPQLDAISVFQVDGRNLAGGVTDSQGRLTLWDGNARITNLKDR